MAADGGNTAGMDPLLHSWSQSLRASGLSPNTIRAYTGAVDRCARHAGAGPSELQSSDVAAYLAAYSGATQSQYFKALNLWALWLQDTGHKKARRRMLAGVRRARVPEREPDPITTKQLSVLLEHVDKRHGLKAMMLLGAYAGLRRHEIAKFKGTDIGPSGLFVDGKGGKSARIPAHPLILEHARLMPEGLWFPSGSDPTAPRSPTSVGIAMRRAMRRSGIPGGHAHQLRAWYATELVRSGAPLTTVRVMMRHTHLSSTQAYVLVGRDDCESAVLMLPAA